MKFQGHLFLIDRGSFPLSIQDSKNYYNIPPDSGVIKLLLHAILFEIWSLYIKLVFCVRWHLVGCPVHISSFQLRPTNCLQNRAPFSWNANKETNDHESSGPTGAQRVTHEASTPSIDNGITLRNESNPSRGRTHFASPPSDAFLNALSSLYKLTLLLLMLLSLVLLIGFHIHTLCPDAHHKGWLDLIVCPAAFCI